MRFLMAILAWVAMTGATTAQELSRRDLQREWDAQMDNGPHDASLADIARRYAERALETRHPRRVANIYAETGDRLYREQADPVLIAETYLRAVRLLEGTAVYGFYPDRRMIDRALDVLPMDFDNREALDLRLNLLAMRAINWDFGDREADSARQVLETVRMLGLQTHEAAPMAAFSAGRNAYHDGETASAYAYFVAGWIFANRLGNQMSGDDARIAEAWGRAALQNIGDDRSDLLAELEEMQICAAGNPECLPLNSNHFGFASPDRDAACVPEQPPRLRMPATGTGYDFDALYLIEYDVDTNGRVRNDVFLYPTGEEEPSFTILRAVRRLDFPRRDDPSQCQNLLALLGYANHDEPPDRSIPRYH